MSDTQSEQVLENNLIKQLGTLGYDFVELPDEKALLANLKRQLETHNQLKFSTQEFRQIRLFLDKGNVFERAKILRDKMPLHRDDGTVKNIEFINKIDWCQNQYQVSNQITVTGDYQNRYDVTLLINGLPLVQIELKRRGLELKEAFNQINRYQRHSYWAETGLFNYIQLFVISNGVNTKYFANRYGQSFKFSFFWADKENKKISNLDDFSRVFLEKCHLSKMITQYIVMNETDKALMVLRPYQYYAVEAIIDKVKNSTHNGYVWHTTGSGKTLTSFKAAQILERLPKVHKILFVVDRKDLDDQTIREFNAFKQDSVSNTDKTETLVKQLEGDTRLIVTTLQKLNTAITRDRYMSRIAHLKDKKVVFIFDECHRSQFGDTHKRINEYFNNHQMFGFTGTPIFADNVGSNHLGKRTTTDLFGERLHSYVITDAIRDENVLKFSVEYVGRYTQKKDSNTYRDIDVEDINTKEMMDSDKRIEPIVDYILANHNSKTRSRDFTAMFCVSSVDVLCKYYDLFKAKKEAGEHNLRIATIFSYTANEDDKGANDEFDNDPLPNDGQSVNLHSRDKLEAYINDYNHLFDEKTSFTTKDSQSFYNYYRDISKQVKAKKVDILLVVNMFLTGFDSKPLNTLYVDKNLKHHGLLQAFSRTNRIFGDVKSQGNIVCFRNLKAATDEAITLFANKNPQDQIIMEPYEDYVEQMETALTELRTLTPTVDSVNDLRDETEELAFVKAFRETMRLRNVLKTFSDFDFEDLSIEEQEYEDYTSKYKDLALKVRNSKEKEKVSILDEVDFELDLIQRDEINVAYILQLLGQLKDEPDEKAKQKKRKDILDMVSGDVELHSKRALIEKFIDNNLPQVPTTDAIPEHFVTFWTAEKIRAMNVMCEEEGLDPDKINSVIEHYLFSEQEPQQDDVIKTMNKQPRILQRQTVGQRVLGKVMDFIQTFVQDSPE